MRTSPSTPTVTRNDHLAAAAYLMKHAGATALVVAHRPSTVALADTVALLSGGVIAATGSHRHLLASNPEYADLMDVEDLEETA